jgi:alpha-tubulin suppressor-like RCC1 family protein
VIRHRLMITSDNRAGICLALAAAGMAALPLVAAAAPAQAHATAGRPRAVSQNRVQHWGYFFGEHARGTGDDRLSPVTIGLPAPVAQVATSNSTQYALLDNGTVWAWGQGSAGQLGDGSTTDSFTAAVQVQFPPGVKIAYLPTDAMPYDTAMAVDTNGNAWGWGANHGGALCLGNEQSHDTPVQLPLTDVTALAGADGHAVYDADGTVVSCGVNSYGVLGDGSTRGSTVPVPVSGLNGQQVVALVSSWQNAGALLADGEYFDWGYDGKGQLGDGTIGQSSSFPLQVLLPDSSPVTQVAQGGSDPGNGQTMVMLQDGSLFAWGSDEFSQLGDGKTGKQASPEQIFPPPGVQYAVLASGGGTSYAISTTADVYAWGADDEGEIGNGTSQMSVPTPVLVDSGATVISSTAGNVVIGDSVAEG